MILYLENHDISCIDFRKIIILIEKALHNGSSHKVYKLVHIFKFKDGPLKVC